MIFGVDPGSFWGHLGIVLASFWHHLGFVLVSVWPHFGPFWQLSAIFTAFFFADVFGKLTSILSKMMHFKESTFCGFFGDVLGMLMQN